MLLDTSALNALHDLALPIISTGLVGKVLITAFRTMPPPPGSCGFICRWMYDFLQALGENPDKVGKIRETPPPGTPPKTPSDNTHQPSVDTKSTESGGQSGSLMSGSSGGSSGGSSLSIL